jgi:hypothetical protein
MAPIFDENGNQLAESIDDLVKSQGLRDKVKELPKMEARIAELEGQLAVRERQDSVRSVGLPANKMTELFVKAYDGPTDPESIRKAAEEYGLVQSTTTTDDAEQAAELARLQRASGGQTGTAPDLQKEFYAQIAAAKNAKEVAAIYNSELGEQVRALEAASA